MVKYTYDAWGNHTVEDSTECGLGMLNPFRYRGYYYDTETGLYYLQTRYYDPEIGRFVTIDDVAYLDPDTVGGLNLYAYCNNNPVMCVDPWGTKSFLAGLERIVNFIGDVLPEISWSLHDNDRFRDLNPWHEQLFAIETSFLDLDLSESTFKLLQASFDFCTGGWEWENLDISLLDFGHAELYAGASCGIPSMALLISGWSPSISFSFKDVSVEVGIEIFSYGYKFGKIGDNWEIALSNGLGISLSFQ